jgi:hypothetical protein
MKCKFCKKEMIQDRSLFLCLCGGRFYIGDEMNGWWKSNNKTIDVKKYNTKKYSSIQDYLDNNPSVNWRMKHDDDEDEKEDEDEYDIKEVKKPKSIWRKI